MDISIKNTQELLQGMEMKTWISDRSTASVKVQAILHQGPTPQVITDLITHLFALYNDAMTTTEAMRCWDILATSMMTGDRLAWVIRLLDVLIVAIGIKQVTMETMLHGIETMIRMALQCLWSEQKDGVALAEAGYWLAYSISMGQEQQQRQVKNKN